MRVIAGKFGGRRLKAPRGRVTRPTSDRVRESMFMALEPLADLRVVDLFAGSGALGIEALSRRAAWADFVEPDRAARAALEENLELLGIGDRAAVWSLHLPQGLKRLAEPLRRADVVLLDPPYGGDRALEMLERLGVEGTLSAAVRVVVEHHRRDVLPELCGVLARSRERRYGETVVSTYGTRPAPGRREEVA